MVADGDELKITWEANFVPDASNNHIHVYWDTYTADQVSNDAAARGVDQGEWVPDRRLPRLRHRGGHVGGEARRLDDLCVTAGDSDHNVIDSVDHQLLRRR